MVTAVFRARIAGKASQLIVPAYLPSRPWARTSPRVDGYPRQVWIDDAGEEMIKSYSITRMARGTPLATVKPKSRLRRSRPFSARGGHLVLISHREVFGLTGEGGAKPENASLLPY